MHRFFVSPEVLQRQPVVLTGDQAHHIRRVLRLRLGERVTLLDGRGRAGEAMLIALDDSTAKFQLVSAEDVEAEPSLHITLYQAVLKGERFGWALQKGTEVGISRFVPVVCERNVVDDLDAVEDKRERWQKIILEAAEQSGRTRLPELMPAQLFGQAVQDAPTQGESLARLIPWEAEKGLRLRDALKECNLVPGSRIQVFIGPEGGLTEQEIALARRYGIRPVSLGARVLRAETAGLVAAAAILYEAGEY